MKHFTLNDKPGQCPEEWPEVTLEQLLKLQAGPNRSIESIVICTGIPEEEWNKSNDFKLIEEIGQTLAFLSTIDGLDYTKKPEKFVFNGVEVPQISDIGAKGIGQYRDLKDLVATYELAENDEVVQRLSLYPKIVSIYIQPIITGGEYDYLKAEEIAKELYNHSAMEVCAWGAFFIQKFQGLRNGIMKDVQKSVTKQKSQKPGFLSYLKTLAGRRWPTT
jgi:hypothetical protein